VEEFDRVRDWPIAYHGTSDENAAKILLVGFRRPGDRGVSSVHGQGGSSTRQTIYVTPSIYYAGHPEYSPLVGLEDGVTWGQIVLQCKIRPGSWRARHNTLGARHWDPDICFDPNFPSNDNIEFLLEDPHDVVVVGIMYRELGQGADRSVYGDLVTRVIDDQSVGGPEYTWTHLLSQHHRAQGLLTTSAAAA